MNEGAYESWSAEPALVEVIRALDTFILPFHPLQMCLEFMECNILEGEQSYQNPDAWFANKFKLSLDTSILPFLPVQMCLELMEM